MSTIFEDSFGGSGGLDGRSPEVGFDSLTWVNDPNLLGMTGGWLRSVDTTNAMSYGAGDYGNPGVNNTHAENFTFAFTIKTPSDVDPISGGRRGVRISLYVGGKTFFVSLRTYFSGPFELEFNAGSSVTAAPTLLPDTEYEGVFTMSNGAQQIELVGETLNLTETYDNDDGLSAISVLVGNGFGLKDLLMEGAIEPVFGDYLDDSGVLSSHTGPDEIASNTLDATGDLASSISAAVSMNVRDSSGVLSSSLTFQLEASTNVLDHGVLTSSVSFDLDLNVLDATGVLTSSISSEVQANSLDQGVLSSSIAGTVEHSFNVLDASGVLGSFVTTGTAADDVLDNSGVLSSSVTTQRISTLDVLDSTGVLSSSVEIGGVAEMNVLDDSGVLTSSVTSQVDAVFNVLDDSGVLSSFATYDALWQAWVMNAQFAMARYDGLLFQSAAVLDGRIIALGTSGFFELTGEDDDGAPIEAVMRTGRLQMGSDKLKFLSDIHVGYTSSGTMEVSITQYGKKKGTFTYKLPATDAEAPRAGRIKPGKGLESQYYLFEFRNTDGARLALDYAHTIPLPSAQRSF